MKGFCLIEMSVALFLISISVVAVMSLSLRLRNENQQRFYREIAVITAHSMAINQQLKRSNQSNLAFIQQLLPQGYSQFAGNSITVCWFFGGKQCISGTV